MPSPFLRSGDCSLARTGENDTEPRPGRKEYGVQNSRYFSHSKKVQRLLPEKYCGSIIVKSR